MEEILASIRRIIADDQDGLKPGPSAPPSNSKPSSDDVLDLAELTPANLPDLDLEHEDVSFRDSDGQIDFDAIPVDEEPTAPAVHNPEPDFPPAPPPAAPRAETPAETLLSSAANASVSSAFGLLGATVLNNNARTLEDLVKDLLRPMLKGWLDENLPPLVERLVRAEIERIARGSR
jgi:cell pole-organizing protein PopZ